MKKISRLTALLLALLMLSPAALATDDAIHQGDLTIDNYASMVAAAQSTSDAVGKMAVTNQDNVEVNSEHYSTGWMGSKVIDTLEKGAIVTITSVNGGLLDGYFSQWYGVSYEKDSKTVTGYIQTKYLDVQEPAPEIGYTPWDGVSETITLSCSADAVAYEWQRGLVGDDCEITWETIEGATSAELTLDATLENLQYVYRCVTKDDGGAQIATREPVALISDELMQWVSSSETEVSMEMLMLAAQATSLDSMMLVDNKLIHVRTGEVFATYDAETGYLTDTRFSLVFARVENDMLMPFVAQPEAEPAAEIEQ